MDIFYSIKITMSNNVNAFKSKSVEWLNHMPIYMSAVMDPRFSHALLQAFPTSTKKQPWLELLWRTESSRLRWPLWQTLSSIRWYAGDQWEQDAPGIDALLMLGHSQPSQLSHTDHEFVSFGIAPSARVTCHHSSKTLRVRLVAVSNLGLRLGSL